VAFREQNEAFPEYPDEDDGGSVFIFDPPPVVEEEEEEGDAKDAKVSFDIYYSSFSFSFHPEIAF
jgi:hypothetical protein